MSKTTCFVSVAFTVHDPDHLPPKASGDAMYSDDVAAEVRREVSKAIAKWYKSRGHDLLACPPDTY